MKTNSIKSIWILITFVCLSLVCTHRLNAQTSVSNPLENTSWIVQVPDNKGYSTSLEFTKDMYTNTFTYNGESCSVSKSYSVTLVSQKTRGLNSAIGKIKIAETPNLKSSQVDQFEIIELTGNKLVLKNISTGAVINCKKK